MGSLIRSKLLVLKPICLAVICFAYAWPTFGQVASPPPLSLDELKKALREAKTGLPVTSRILIKEIEERGISFEIDDESEKQLISAGATKDIIDGIREWLCDKFTALSDLCPDGSPNCKIRYLTKAIGFHPGDASVLLSRGAAYFGSKNYDEAIADFDKVISIDRRSGDAYYYRAYSLQEKGDDEGALRDYREASALAPKQPLYCSGLAAQYFNLKSYIESAKEYTRCIALAPKDEELYLDRGDAFLESGKFDPALRDYAVAIAANTTDVRPLFGRARALLGKKQYHVALAVLNRVIGLDPKHAEGFYLRGYISSKNKEWKKAIEDYSRSIELAASPANYGGRGTAYDSSGDAENAFGDYSKAIELGPVPYTIYYNRGLLFAARNDHRKAILDFSKAAELEAKDPDIFFDRASAYIEITDYQLALKDLDRVLKLSPKNSDALTSRGLIFLRLEKYDQSVAETTAAVKIDPNNGTAYLYRSIAYDAMGDTRRAAADRKRADALEKPANPN